MKTREKIIVGFLAFLVYLCGFALGAIVLPFFDPIVWK